MNRSPSENLDNLLLALAKLEYRDFVGIKLALADSLITVMRRMIDMLKYEKKVRDVQTFMPSKRTNNDSGTFM